MHEKAELNKQLENDEIWKINEFATYWIENCYLDSQYLSPSSRIWIWSDENDVIICWDNSEIKVEGISVWSAIRGSYRMSRKDFLGEVRKFDRLLFSEMQNRVEDVCQNWYRPDIKIDFEQLKSEQKNRAMWLESNLKHIYKTDWENVISAIKIVEEDSK